MHGETNSKNLRAASFFSGYSGASFMGFQNAGFEISFQCEIEPFCNDCMFIGLT